MALPHATYDHRDLFTPESGPVASSSPARFALAAFLNMARRHVMVILASTLAFAALAGIYVLLATPRFAGTADVLTETDRGAPSPGDSSRQSLVDPSVIESQIAILKSDGLARNVIAKLDLTHDPEFIAPGTVTRFLAALGWDSTPNPSQLEDRALGRFERALTVTRIEQSYVAEIAFNSENANKAAEIANAIAAAYIQDQLDARQATAQRAGQWMETWTDQLRRQAADAARALSDFRNANQTVIAGQEQPATADRLTALEKAAAAKRDAYEAIKTRSARLRQFVEDQSFPFTQARVVSAAAPPSKPSSPKVAIIMGLAIFCGGIFGLAAANLRDGFDRSLHTPEQMRDALETRHAFAVPWPKRARLSADVDRRVLGALGGAGGNALWHAKAALDRYIGPSQSRVVGLVSMRDKDGRATIACALAEVLARSGSRTLLADFDTHHKALTRAIAPHSPALRRAPERDGAVAAIDGDYDFFPATLIAQSNCLNAARVTAAVKRFRQAYDYVIIDLPPILEGPEAAVAAVAVDGCIVVAHAGCSNADDVARACDLLLVEPEQIILGLLLQRADLPAARPVRSLATVNPV